MIGMPPAKPDTAKSTPGFEDMGLHVGASMFIRPQDPNQAQVRYQVEYLGALRGKTLLVSLPVANGKGIWMQNGQEYVFHVVAGMYVYGFTSQVLRARNSPAPYVHFAWPSRIDARRVRKSYRVKLRLPVTVERGGERLDGLLLDLSMTGALLEAAEADWREGEPMRLVLPVTLDEHNGELTLSATIRNREDRAIGKLCRYGVEFVEVAQGDALLLHYYIDHTIAMRIG